MKLEKAIEILTYSATKPQLYRGDIERKAQRLGIEALKGIKKIRKTLEPYVTALLPGETE